MIQTLILSSALLGAGAGFSGQAEIQPALAGTLRPGRSPVGFRKETVELRGALPGEPSSVDLYLWYPAASSVARSMTFADYYRAQEDDEPSREDLLEWLLDDMTSPPNVDAGQLSSVLDAPMWAIRDAEADGERHPLVLWSYRDSVPTMQALLNEYVASHGYVVVFAWPRNETPPFPWEDGLTAEEKSHALDVQVRMLSSVLDTIGGRDGIDGSSTSVLSWSYGGESAGALQRSRRDVRLVVGIDSTIVSGWVYRSSEALTSMDRRLLDVPYALLRNGRPRIDGDERPEPPLLREIPAGSWFVQFSELSHGNFNFPGGMVPGVLGLREVSSWAVGGESARLGYEWICRLVLAVLNFERDEAWPDDVPEGFIEVTRHVPQR